MKSDDTDSPPVLRYSQTAAALASLIVFWVVLIMSRPGISAFLKQENVSFDNRAVFVALVAGIPAALAGAAFAAFARWGGEPPSLVARILAWPGLVLNGAIPLAWLILWFFKK